MTATAAIRLPAAFIALLFSVSLLSVTTANQDRPGDLVQAAAQIL